MGNLGKLKISEDIDWQPVELTIAGFCRSRKRLDHLVGLVFTREFMDKHADKKHEQVDRKEVEQ